MAESHPWSQPPTGGTEQPPRIRWVRWLISGIILLTLALVFHTTGRVARLTVVATRHWMTVSSRLPQDALKHIPVTLQRIISQRSSAVATATTKRDWIAPLSGARMKTSFGWHGTGARAQFESGVVLGVVSDTPVQAGVSGTVSAENHNQITVRVLGGYDVTMGPLAEIPRILHHHISPLQVIGKTAADALTLEVTRDTYPVNPLSSTLYGTLWLRP